LKALVLGGGGFIGTHLIKRLKTMDFHVTSVDLKANEFTSDSADVFVKADLRQVEVLRKLSESQFDWIFQLAADMGGAGYVFSREHDADIMHNSALINLNVLDNFKSKSSTIFYASSACIYPEENQLDPQNPNCAENTAYRLIPTVNMAGRSFSVSDCS
jgi:nucleoside-diphosphate-sugar epimerase